MRRILAAASVILLTLASQNAIAQWKPAAGPLMTKWAKDVDPAKPLPEYPRPQMVRENWTNLNGLWDYAVGEKDAGAPAAWEGKILVPFPVESALSGVMKRVDGKRLWYRRTFARPQGERILLHFGAVDWDTTVLVNGKEIGKHQGGFDPFSFDITDSLKDGENELVVSVFDPTNDGPQPRGKQVKRPGGIYYTPVTGIWQTVWLEGVPKSYVQSLKITPSLDESEVKIEVNLVGGSNDPRGNNFRVTVTSGGNPVNTTDNEQQYSRVQRIKIPDAKHWSVDTPHLYDITVQANGDTVKSYFGLRKIEVKKDDKGVNRIFLNNKEIFMCGPLDQGFWPDGIYTAPTDEALKYDIEITKKLGFNCTRKHVKVEPARWYYWCDKLGLLVWQDMPSGERGVGPGQGEIKRTPASAGIYEKELKAMIDAFHNYPSIIMWVVFNEGWGQYDTVRITNWTKQYDPTRLINAASGWNDYPAGHVIDAHVYPGPGAPKLQENRAAVLGEFGGLGLATPGHMWEQRNWGYRNVTDQKSLTRQYAKLLSRSYALKDSGGLCAAIYTQLTDVETEANGLLTYDRAVMKVDLDTTVLANTGKLPPPPPQRTILADARKEPAQWRYTTEKPADDWMKPGFDDKAWKEGTSGFGTAGTPGAVVGTEWKTNDIWLRREVDLSNAKIIEPLLLVHHDEDTEIYINGVLAAKLTGHTTDYEEFDISPEARKALTAGELTIAVKCHQTRGGQYIDVGIVDTK